MMSVNVVVSLEQYRHCDRLARKALDAKTTIALIENEEHAT